MKHDERDPMQPGPGDPIGPDRYERLCEFVFGELDEETRAAFEAELANDPALAAERTRLEATIDVVQDALPADELPPAMRATLTEAARAKAAEAAGTITPIPRCAGGGTLSRWFGSPARAAAACLLLLGGGFALNALMSDGFEEGTPTANLPSERREKKSKLAESFRDVRDRAATQRSAEPQRSSAELDSLGYSGVETDSEVTDALEALGYAAEDSGGLATSTPYRGPGDTTPPRSAEPVQDSGDGAGTSGSYRGRENTASPKRVAGSIQTEPLDGARISGAATRGPRSRQSFTFGTFGGTSNYFTAVSMDVRQAERIRSAATESDGFFLGRGQRKAESGSEVTLATGSSSVADSPLKEFPLNQSRDGSEPSHDWRDTSALAGAKSSAGGGASGPSGPTTPGPTAAQSPGPSTPSEAAERQRLAADREQAEEAPANERASLSDLGYGGEQANELSAEELETLAAVGYDGDDDEAERQARREDDTRQPVVTFEQIDAYAADLFLLCSIAEDETPGAMFFRCWGAHPFQRTADDQLSTFAVDVDTASYTLARRTLQAGRLPVREQVRTEEFVNYFRADQAAPTDGVFAIGVESAPSLFHGDPNVELLRVTVRGKDVESFERQPLALTFVIDVSGSMSGQLDLVKRSLALLLTQLEPRDSIALVKFSNTADVVSPMVSAANRGAVEDALAALGTEGGTNVEAGITAGYELAANALTRGAVNRVILLSDGVGNIGETKAESLLALVDANKTEGIYLNTIGVGLGNDDFLEQLANRGDGVCLYIDSEEAAQKALVDEFTKALQPIARDVKIQVEFDPNQVERYRQLGYENRVIADADFRKDAVDAGEVNAGHQVTALYEIVRIGGRAAAPLAMVRVRYKPSFAVDEGQLGRRAKADAEVALEIERAASPNDFVPTFETGSAGYRRAVLVAQFAELLRESVHTRDDSLDHFEREVMRFADRASDEETIEFSELVAIALPMLREREQERSDELQDLIEELCQLEYAAGVREQMARREEAPEPDPEVELAFQKEIEGVQAKIRELLGARFGLTEPELEKAEKLKALGYTDQR